MGTGIGSERDGDRGDGDEREAGRISSSAGGDGGALGLVLCISFQ